MLKPKKIIGYDGPTGPYVVVDGRVVAATDPAGLIALTDAALLTALGYSEKASQYSEIAQGHGAVTAS